MGENKNDIKSRLKKDKDTILKPKTLNVNDDEDIFRDEVVEIEDGILMSQSEIIDFAQGSDSYL